MINDIGDHMRINPKTLEMVCTHCGVTEPVAPALTRHLEDQIAEFNTKHSVCPVPVFKAGDRVVFCGEEATVLTNHGSQGTVDLGGGEKCMWYWEFQGERVMPFVAGAKRA